MEDTHSRQMVQGILKFFPDIYRLGKRFQRGSGSLQVSRIIFTCLINPKDVVRVYQVVVKLPELLNALQDNQGVFKEDLQRMLIQPISEKYEVVQKLQELVETTIDLAALENHEYVIKAEFDERLLGILDLSLLS